MTGKSHSSKTKKVMSEKHKIYYDDPANLLKHCERQKEVCNTKECVLKHSKIMQGFWADPKWADEQRNSIIEKRGSDISRAKSSEASKKNWLITEYRHKVLDRRGKSKPEETFEYICKKYDLSYIFVGNGQICIDRKIPDFISIKDDHKLIEIWGEYFKKGRNPQDLIDFYKARGYECIVILASELKSCEQVVAKIRAFDAI